MINKYHGDLLSGKRSWRCNSCDIRESSDSELLDYLLNRYQLSKDQCIADYKKKFKWKLSHQGSTWNAVKPLINIHDCTINTWINTDSYDCMYLERLKPKYSMIINEIKYLN